MAIKRSRPIRRIRYWTRRTFKKGGKFERVWNSTYTGCPLWIISAVFCLRWTFFHVPPPGYSIGALAVVAGLMSVREMKVLGKITWVVLLICLLITEFRAINKDRAENERQQREFFEEQKAGFTGIATQASNNFAGTTAGLTTAINGLKGVLNTTEGVARLSRENLEELSGAGAHPCVVPQPAPNGSAIPLVIWNRGKHVLTGVEVRLLSSQEFLDGHSILYKPSVNIGTLRYEWPKPIPEPILPIPDEKGIASYQIEIWTQNGFYVEVINFTRGRHNQWSSQYWLTNQAVTWKDGKRVGMMGSLVPDCKMAEWSDDLIDKQNVKPQSK
jgi:hypothetical protein